MLASLVCVRARPLRTVEVNTLAHFWTAKAFLPAMIAQDSGHIVNVSSASGFFGAPRMVDYCASKFAARGFSDALRLELITSGASGVEVSCVCPSHVNTELFKGFKVALPLVMPTLEPEYVAQRIVDAVRDRQSLVCAPRFVYLAAVMTTVMPQGVTDLVNRLTGVTSAMNAFVPKKAEMTFGLMEGGVGVDGGESGGSDDSYVRIPTPSS